MRVAWKRYLPDDSSMDPNAGAGVFQKLLIATPFLLVATIGMKTQIAKDRFEFVACTAKENSKITAYGRS